MDALVLVAVVGGLVAFVNLLVTTRLWESELFETSQKIAQTILMWLIPGFVFVVWYLVRQPTDTRAGDDSTSSNPPGIVDQAMTYSGSGDGENGGPGHP